MRETKERDESRTRAWLLATIAAWTILLGVAHAASAGAPTLAPPAPLALPGGAAMLDLDDLQFDAGLGRLLVPAAESGNLDLVDPASKEVTPIAIATADPSKAAEVTSAAVGAGLIFTADGEGRRLIALDARTHAIAASAPLAAGPDYVRFVAERDEVWVTEPRAEAIEIFALQPGSPPQLSSVAQIVVKGGPEALAFDVTRGRAYTNLWHEQTVVLDVARRAETTRWSSGCADPRGLAFDAARGFLFVGCKDGTLAALDVAADGKLLSSLRPGEGTDIIAFDAGRRHLYAPAGRSATLAIVGVSDRGELSLLATSPAVEHAHCVATDQNGTIFVCDPTHGRLLVYRDDFPPSR